jgi:aminoglycoside 3-N-acetyltransferase
MGVGLTSLTLLHAAEEDAGRLPFRRWANDAAGDPQALAVGGCASGFANFTPHLAPLTHTLLVGQSEWRCLPARETLAVAAAAIRRNPLLTHCGRQECERCNDALAGGPLIGYQE